MDFAVAPYAAVKFLWRKNKGVFEGHLLLQLERCGDYDQRCLRGKAAFWEANAPSLGKWFPDIFNKI